MKVGCNLLHTTLCLNITVTANIFRYHLYQLNEIGLTDGESLERLWSYLGRFVATTKYMRPSPSLIRYFGIKALAF